jgi:hypothetical protein
MRADRPATPWRPASRRGEQTGERHRGEPPRPVDLHVDLSHVERIDDFVAADHRDEPDPVEQDRRAADEADRDLLDLRVLY